MGDEAEENVEDDTTPVKKITVVDDFEEDFA